MGAYLNRIATAVPPHDVHAAFVAYATQSLPATEQPLYRRMAQRSGIAHRYSVLSEDELVGGLYRPGAFPGTSTRMQLYRKHAFPLALRALDQLGLGNVTHLLVTSCTGFYAPGLDLDIIAHYGLPASVERTQIGFMGCYAAINALKLARHIVTADPAAHVLILNIELCTLHLQEGAGLEDMLSFTIFADGCAAGIVSAEATGLELQGFHAALLPDSVPYIIWAVGDAGFLMELSGKVAGSLQEQLPELLPAILHGNQRDEIMHWAIHPGGRSILDAVERSCDLPADALAIPRDILSRYGNMSSATVMFVLRQILESGMPGLGCAMAFGPGVMAETMLFDKVAT